MIYHLPIYLYSYLCIYTCSHFYIHYVCNMYTYMYWKFNKYCNKPPSSSTITNRKKVLSEHYSSTPWLNLLPPSLSFTNSSTVNYTNKQNIVYVDWDSSNNFTKIKISILTMVFLDITIFQSTKFWAPSPYKPPQSMPDCLKPPVQLSVIPNVVLDS